MPIANSCNIHESVNIPCPELVNMYGCIIHKNAFIGPFVEIQNNTEIGEETRVQSHSFICEAVKIGKRVFVGHGVIFVNDKNPKVNNPDWVCQEVIVEDDVSIGSGAIIMCGIKLGKGCVIGSGAVVTHNVLPGQTVAGVPARLLK